MLLDRPEFDHKRTPLGCRLVTQISSIRSKDGAGDIETQARRSCAWLKRFEQIIRACDTGTGILKSHRDHVVFFNSLYRERLNLAVSHGMLAVTRQVQENLQQTVVIGLNQGQSIGNVPGSGTTGIAKRGVHHDPGFVQHHSQIGCWPWRGPRPNPNQRPPASPYPR